MDKTFYARYRLFALKHLYFQDDNDSKNDTKWAEYWSVENNFIEKWDAEEDIIEIDMFWQAQLFSLASKFLHYFAQEKFAEIYDFYRNRVQSDPHLFYFVCEHSLSATDTKYTEILKNNESFFRNYSYITAKNYAGFFIRIFNDIDNYCDSINALDLLKTYITNKEFTTEFSKKPKDFSNFLYRKIVDKLSENTVNCI